MTTDHNGRYILEGHTPVPCPDLVTWARWYEDTANRVVAQDELPGGVAVSTVFLGVDRNFHNFHGLDRPRIFFETTVFGGPLDSEQQHYATWDEAVAGHAEMLARAIAAAGPS